MRREETFRYVVILENPRQMGKSDLSAGDGALELTRVV
ncbi:hypothetical protein V7x_34050 [Crateriforma conspicua]|uniref:Uncharacterized protein n=1 Tax=Crateriforma conspicua TaxID=2527996 RepID=A0A5C6FI64_9PLAN|nr:hypothetical protein V7x_34050 [Crateriforma conspicua]